jgi:hypothetical protein
VRGWNHVFYVVKRDNFAEGFWDDEYDEEMECSYLKFFHAQKEQPQKLTAAQVVEKADNKILELLDRAWVLNLPPTASPKTGVGVPAPADGDHRFRLKATSRSDGWRPPVPTDGDQLWRVVTGSVG